MAALHHVFLVKGHVVTQIVKAHLIVSAIGNIAGIGFFPLIVIQPVHNQTDGKAEETMDFAHPFAVTPGKVVIHRDDMHALAGKRIQIGRKNRDERFPFTRLHFGNAPLMKHNAAYHLNIERLHPQHAPCRFTRSGECLRQKIVKRFAVLQALPEQICLSAQLLIRQRGVFVFQRHYALCNRMDLFQFAVCIASKQFIKKSHFYSSLADNSTVYIIAQ